MKQNEPSKLHFNHQEPPIEILFLCDKKPGACKSFERQGWNECQSLVCKHTTKVDHARNVVGTFELQHDGHRFMLVEVEKNDR